MVIDTSALIAILHAEPEVEPLMLTIDRDAIRLM